MGRSAGGKTEVRSLGAPDTLKPVLKASPEAFLARRVVLCEGKTEYGLVLALINRWNDEQEQDGALPAAAIGVVGVEGRGGTGRSEAPRVGKGCVSTCRSRGSPYH